MRILVNGAERPQASAPGPPCCASRVAHGLSGVAPGFAKRPPERLPPPIRLAERPPEFGSRTRPIAPDFGPGSQPFLPRLRLGPRPVAGDFSQLAPDLGPLAPCASAIELSGA